MAHNPLFQIDPLEKEERIEEEEEEEEEEAKVCVVVCAASLLPWKTESARRGKPWKASPFLVSTPPPSLPSSSPFLLSIPSHA